MSASDKCIVVAVAFLLSSVSAQADVSISSKPTQNMNCDAGICTATAQSAVLNVSDLQIMLAVGDVTVKTGAAGDIDIRRPLTWASTKRLTLDANKSVFVSKSVSVTGTGALTVTTNDGGTGGDLSFGEGGHIEFQNSASSLVINGTTYILADSLSDLAADIENNLSGSFALAKGYDAGRDGIHTVSPLGALTGTLEGLGNKIDRFRLHLATNSTEGGLFTCDCPGSVVRDLVIDRADIRGADNADSVGILAGESYGVVKGVRVSGSVRGSASKTVNDTVGGLLGSLHGEVIDSHSSATVSSGMVVGGLIGDVDPAGASPPTISNSSSTGDVAGRAGGDAGGLVGMSGLTDSSEVIMNSFATGIVSDNGCNACGGLVGSNVGSVANSYAVGAVNAKHCVACGGMVGANSGKISDSYSTATVIASGGLAGGFVGKDTSAPGSLNNDYWDLDTSGIGDTGKGAGNIANDPGITGVSDAQLTSGLPAGFDTNVWGQVPIVNTGYPYLLANPPAE
jgi:hypothetical protein